ncbi:hypothetical protein J3D48_005635 [Pseudomonas fluorescens]|uniref:DUF4376 domain-containing protein n=1 Tax=Pseudomonas fluorescens TaxID=294 RepID=UPI00209CC1DA|nr:hypothetical protein [Pseudomonas fluorescens]MCP1489322.1 hypothetical protein [Pseudomonas fluorescens]
MQRFYSASTGTTYLSSIHTTMPADAKPISDERYLQVIANPAPQKVRGHDLDGLPILIDPPQLDAGAHLVERHAALFAAVNTACELEITSGFDSAALGARYVYSSQLEDQLNLTGVVLLDVDSAYPCSDEQGSKAFRVHTRAQLRQVSDDFTVFKLQLLQKANELKQQLDQALAAADLAGLEAVSWEGVQP